jgi:hypothetical protein
MNTSSSRTDNQSKLLMSLLVLSSVVSMAGLTGMNTASLSDAYAATSASSSKDSHGITRLTLDYGTGGKKFEVVNERYLIQQGTLKNNQNFKFFSDLWHEVSHGDIATVKINKNPTDIVIKLVNVLNPITKGRQDIKDMKLGAIVITLANAPNDNGQHRRFIITNDIPSGYYLANIIVKFPSEGLYVVYTGKLFIASSAGPANIDNIRSTSVTLVRQGNPNVVIVDPHGHGGNAGHHDTGTTPHPSGHDDQCISQGCPDDNNPTAVDDNNPTAVDDNNPIVAPPSGHDDGFEQCPADTHREGDICIDNDHN